MGPNMPLTHIVQMLTLSLLLSLMNCSVHQHRADLLDNAFHHLNFKDASLLTIDKVWPR